MRRPVLPQTNRPRPRPRHRSLTVAVKVSAIFEASSERSMTSTITRRTRDTPDGMPMLEYGPQDPRAAQYRPDRPRRSARRL
jgi:hypothetical protein